MKRVLAGAALFATCAAAMPQMADAYSGRRNTTIHPVDETRFEVMAPTAGGAQVYWCGAGDYAARVLRADWTARIYVARGRGPSETTGRKTAVQFTMNPAAVGVTPIRPALFMNAFRSGDSMSVNQAVSYCSRPRLLY